MRGIKKLFWIPIVAMLLLSMTSGAFATVEGDMFVDPNLVFAGPGEIFTVNVMAHHVKDLFLWEFTMYFDPSVLDALDAIPVSFELFVVKEIEMIPGKIVIIGTRELGIKVGLTGLLTLATISFQVKTHGESIIRLTKTGMIDINGEAIPHFVSGGFFDTTMPMTAPCLWIRDHGAKLWIESSTVNQWEVNPFYATISNDRPGGTNVHERELVPAYVCVNFKLYFEEADMTMNYWSDEQLLPGDSTVTLVCNYGASLIGHFTVTGVLYYRTSLSDPMVPYFEVQGSLGGEGISRDMGATTFVVS